MKNKLVTTVMTMGFRRRSIRNLLRPSVSAYVIINLDETVITEVIEDLIQVYESGDSLKFENTLRISVKM